MRQHLYDRLDVAGTQGRHLLACHPFYTGEQRIVDTAGQVDRFMKRLERTADTVDTIRTQQETQKRTVQQQRLAKRRGDA